MSVQIRTLLRSEMLAPAGKPAANKIGRDVEGCMTAAISTMSSPPGVVMSGTWEVVCVVSPPVASGCIVFVCFVGGIEARLVSSRLAAEVDRCYTTDTSPATVSLSDCMSSADMPHGTDRPYPIRILAFFGMIRPYHVGIRISGNLREENCKACV